MSKSAHLCAALVAALSLCILPGCKSDTDSARLVVTYATLKVIEQGGDTADQARRAARIRAIAGDVQALVEGESVTIGLLETAVRAKLAALPLSPADTFLANELVRLVMAELEARVGAGVLDPEQRIKVAAVLGWVLEAAALAAPA